MKTINSTLKNQMKKALMVLATTFIMGGIYSQKVGDQVVVYWIFDDHYYNTNKEATVLEVKDTMFLVQVNGFSAGSEKWVGPSRLHHCPDLSWYNNHTKLVPNSFDIIDKSKRENEKVIKVVVYDNDWTYLRNSYGTITSRTLNGKAVMQNTLTNLCFSIDIVFSQANTGGSNYAAIQYTREEKKKNPFSIDCLPK